MERVRPNDDDEARLRVWAGVGALVWCALYGWFTVVKCTDVPVLFFMQLGVHELGHRLFAPFGEYPMLLMGSGTEILAPFLLGVGLLVWPGRRDPVGAGACWAVAAAACQHTSLYMADAPRGELLLIGGNESDWLRIFDGYWGTLYKADVYAARMHTLAIVVWIAAVALVVIGIVQARRRLASSVAPPDRPASKATARPTSTVVPVADEQMWR